ncbi:MAG: 4'-phosphopantetheinyl transferase superfamily protein [Lachnospiraceae bacterium]|nr:4'-phosphopantetheinyl transferase superfamily protein [Lachnospiraceae bacterium]
MNNIVVVVKKVDFEYCTIHFDELIKQVYPQRRDAILKLKNKRAACISLIAGLLLQEIIKKRFGIEPKDIVIDTNEQGKPCVKGLLDFYYNISHSGDMIVMAYGDCPVGVDLEEIKSADLRVAKRCFCKEEYQYVLGETDDSAISEEQAIRFLKVWTKKEAYLKYKGIGISVPLDSFCIDIVNDTVEGTDIVFHEKSYDGYICNLCVHRGTKVIYEN